MPSRRAVGGNQPPIRELAKTGGRDPELASHICPPRLTGHGAKLTDTNKFFGLYGLGTSPPDEVSAAPAQVLAPVRCLLRPILVRWRRSRSSATPAPRTG